LESDTERVVADTRISCRSHTISLSCPTQTQTVTYCVEV